MKYDLTINETMKFKCMTIEAVENVIDSVFYADDVTSWKLSWNGADGNLASVQSKGLNCIADFHELKTRNPLGRKAV